MMDLKDIAHAPFLTEAPNLPNQNSQRLTGIGAA